MASAAVSPTGSGSPCPLLTSPAEGHADDPKQQHAIDDKNYDAHQDCGDAGPGRTLLIPAPAGFVRFVAELGEEVTQVVLPEPTPPDPGPDRGSRRRARHPHPSAALPLTFFRDAPARAAALRHRAAPGGTTPRPLAARLISPPDKPGITPHRSRPTGAADSNECDTLPERMGRVSHSLVSPGHSRHR